MSREFNLSSIGSNMEHGTIGNEINQSTIGSEIDPSSIGSNMEHSTIGSEINQSTIGSEIDPSSIGSEIDLSSIGSNMEHSTIGNEINQSTIGSEIDQSAIGSEINGSAIGSDLDESATGSKIDQERMDIPAVLLKESEIKKEVIESDVITISDDEDESDTNMHIPCPNSLLIVKRRSSEPKSFEHCLSVEVAERRCSSVPIDNNVCNELIASYDTIPSVCTSISSGSGGECSSQHKPKKTLKRKRSLIPTHIEIENTRKTMKPGPKSKTRNIATVHEMITEAKNLASRVTIDSSDDSDIEMIVDSDENEEETEEEEEEEDDEGDLSEIEVHVEYNDVILVGSSTENESDNESTDEVVATEFLIISSDTSTNNFDDAAEERDRLSPINNVTINQKEDNIMHNNELIKEEIASDDAAKERDRLSPSNNVTINQKEDNIMHNNELIKEEIASDDAAEEKNRLSPSNNVTINQKEEKIMQNNELIMEGINKTTEDENDNNEKLKNMLTDSNEILKKGE